MTDSKIDSSHNAIGTLTNHVYVPKIGIGSSNKQTPLEPSLSKLQSYVHPDNQDNFYFKKLLEENKQQKITSFMKKK